MRSAGSYGARPVSHRKRFKTLFLKCLVSVIVAVIPLVIHEFSINQDPYLGVPVGCALVILANISTFMVSSLRWISYCVVICAGLWIPSDYFILYGVLVALSDTIIGSDIYSWFISKLTN